MNHPQRLRNIWAHRSAIQETSFTFYNTIQQDKVDKLQTNNYLQLAVEYLYTVIFTICHSHRHSLRNYILNRENGWFMCPFFSYLTTDALGNKYVYTQAFDAYTDKSQTSLYCLLNFIGIRKLLSLDLRLYLSLPVQNIHSTYQMNMLLKYVFVTSLIKTKSLTDLF